MCLVGAYNFCCEQAKQKAIKAGLKLFFCCGITYYLGHDGLCVPQIDFSKLQKIRKNWRKFDDSETSPNGFATSTTRKGYGGQF